MQLSYMILLGMIALLFVVILVVRFAGNRETEVDKLLEFGNEDVFLVNCAGYGLSSREIEVLRLILAGKTYKEMGELLFISKKTVDSHIQRIYAKVGVRNKLALINKVYR